MRVEDDLLARVRAHRLAGQWPGAVWEVLFAALWEEYREAAKPRRAARFAGHLRRALNAWGFEGPPGDPNSLLAILSRERPRARRGRPRGSGRVSPAQVFHYHWWLARQLQRAKRTGANPLDSLRETWGDVAAVPFPEQAARDNLKGRQTLAGTIEGILAAAFDLKVETVHRYRMRARRRIPESALRALGIRHRPARTPGKA